MFFEKDHLSFQLLDVLKLDQREIHTKNSGRNFSALSFRLHSDAILKTESATYQMADHFVSYFPARLDYDRDATIDEMIVIHFDSVDYNTREIECFLPNDPMPFAKLFQEILNVWEKKEIGYRHRCSALLYEILAECYLQNFKATPRQSKIQHSVDYLLANYKNSNLSLKEIAEKSFMSEVYFRKIFKEEYGTSPQKYIIRLRIQNAAGLIATGYYSLAEVALMSGYEDYKYFSVEFKKAMGVSPSEYSYNYHS